MGTKKIRHVLFVSDRTGLTASSYGKSLLAQFPEVQFETETIPFIDSEERARELADKVAALQLQVGHRVIVFSSLVQEELQKMLEATGAFVVDLFNAFIEPLERELSLKSAHTLGISHNVFADVRYQKRMDAIEFSLAHDDGVRPDQYADADVILVGVSRCGKTPTALYLAMNFSLKACNYPLTDDELQGERLPRSLMRWKEKLIGLTIKPNTLMAIREKRRASPQYCSLAVCQREVKTAEQMFSQAGIPVFDSTDTSIEELASGILKHVRLTKA